MKIGNPVSEKYRLAAKEWVELEAAANMLESTKSSVFAQLVVNQGDMPVNRAELNVKASQEWMAHVEMIAEARKAANLAKCRVEYIRMQFSEQQSAEANARSERKM